MNKIVLYVIILFSSVFSQYGAPVITVKLSTMLEAGEKAPKYTVVFDEFRSIEIVIDTLLAESSSPLGKKINKITEKQSDFSFNRPFGVTPSGDYFLVKGLAVNFGDSIPEVSYSPYWGRHKMTESGSFYVYHSGKKITESQSYCFFIYGRKLPGALSTISKEAFGNLKINQWEIVSDDNGGSYFYSAPVEPR